MKDPALVMLRACQLLGIPLDGEETETACPWCQPNGTGSERGKFSITLSKGIYRCWRCNQTGHGASLYAALAMGRDPSEVKGNPQLYYTILRAMGLEEDDGQETVQKKQDWNKTALSLQGQNKPEEKMANLEVIHAAYTALRDMLTLSDADRKSLLARGLSETAIEENGYRTLTSVSKNQVQMLVKRGIDLAGVPGFFKPDDGIWNINTYHKGILIFAKRTDSLEGERYVGAQIRSANAEPGKKYVAFSSSNTRGFCPNGTKAKAVLHMAGYPERHMVLTEGYLKADVIRDLWGYSCIGIPGVENQSQLPELFKRLAELGVKKIWTAFDNDRFTNKNVARAMEKATALIREFGIATGAYIWPREFKGMDDYLARAKDAGKLTAKE